MIDWLKQVLITFAGFAVVYFLIGWLVLKQPIELVDYREVLLKSAAFGLIFGSARYFRNKRKET
ncbi:MAG: hypothetical protein LCH37_05035 [Bacteroidetes bacterium]|nr:hypothetical protein [Bacteroidota bacterium]